MELSKKGARIKICFSFSVLLVLTLFVIQSEYSYWCLLAAAIHEMGHWLAMHQYGERLELVTLNFYGVNMRYCERGGRSLVKDMVVGVSGPLFNLLMAGVLFIINVRLGGEMWEYAYKTQLTVGLFNLLPIHQLDGGQILSSLLRKFFPLHIVDQITFWVSLIFAGCLGFCILRVTMLQTFNYSLLAVVVYLAMSLYRFYG